jgi:small subunit ribosomal protein S16
LAVKLRLRRMGKKKQPIYKVVAADSRSPRDGKFIEAIGLYNPKTDPATVDIKEERALYWLSVGAQPTDTVKNLLSNQGIILKKELKKNGLNEEQISVKFDDWKKIKEANLASSLKKKSEKVKTKKASAEKKDSETEVKGTTSEQA